MLSSLPKTQAWPKVKEPTRTAQQKLKQTLPDVESELKLRFLNLCVVPRQEVGSKKEAVLTPALRPKAFQSKLKKTAWRQVWTGTQVLKFLCFSRAISWCKGRKQYWHLLWDPRSRNWPELLYKNSRRIWRKSTRNWNFLTLGFRTLPFLTSQLEKRRLNLNFSPVKVHGSFGCKMRTLTLKHFKKTYCKYLYSFTSIVPQVICMYGVEKSWDSWISLLLQFQ